MYVRIVKFLAVIASFAGSATLQAAQSQDSTSESQRDPAILVLGVAATPEFEGADTLQVVPLVVSRFRLGTLPVQITGTQVRLGVVESGHWWAGPLLGFTAP